MITKEKKIEKICSFYASDYHLEMIMLPYINRKIEEKANIIIITEKNLTESLKTVISKMNLSEKRKEEILDLNWDNNSVKNIKLENISKELIIFVVGNVEYINEINQQFEQKQKNINMKIINCYSIEEVQNNVTEIVLNHSKVLNTTEEKELD